MSEKKNIMKNGVPVAFTFKPSKAETLQKTKQDKMILLLQENNKLLKELVKKLDN